MSHQIILPKSAQKALDRLPDEVAARIMEALEGLKNQPRPPDCKKLRGENARRIRAGDYRVIYEINREESQVVILFVGHRSKVYDELSKVF